VGVEGTAGEASSLPGSVEISTDDLSEGGSVVSSISFVAGICAEIVRSGRSSMVERRGVMLAWGVVPSTADSEIPSCDVFMANGLACLYVTGGVCFQGHHANILLSQRLIACVIIVSLLSVC